MPCTPRRVPRTLRTLPTIAAFATCTLAAGCIGSPTADAATAEAINEIGNELGMLRDENAQLQFQVDSLRGALARQDTLLRQVANLSGVPIP